MQIGLYFTLIHCIKLEKSTEIIKINPTVWFVTLFISTVLFGMHFDPLAL